MADEPVLSLEATLALKREAKFDCSLEESVKGWISSLLPDFSVDDPLADTLKDGSVLCSVLNNVAPGAISKIYSGRLPFKQMENISIYLSVCTKLGMKDSDLFETTDLFNGKDIMRVIQHVETMRLFTSRLSPEEISQRLQQSSTSKEELTSDRMGKAREQPSSMRKKSPKPQRSAFQTATPTARAPSKSESVSAFDDVSSPPHAASTASSSVAVTSLTKDVATRAEFKYNPELEKIARDWMGEVLGDPLPAGEFAEILKSGVILCKLLNILFPGTIAKINDKRIPYLQMENIASFLRGCTEVAGLSPSEVFDTPDLFEEKNLHLVVNTVIVLGNKMSKDEEYDGPVIGDTTKTKSLWQESLVPTAMDFTDEGPETHELPEKEKSLVEWFNGQLDSFFGSAKLVKNLGKSLRDGVALCQLIMKLTGVQSLMFDPKPVFMHQLINNSTSALRFLQTQTYEDIEFCKARDIVSANTSKTMQLVEYLREKFDMEYYLEQVLADEMGDDVDSDYSSFDGMEMVIFQEDDGELSEGEEWEYVDVVVDEDEVMDGDEVEDGDEVVEMMGGEESLKGEEEDQHDGDEGIAIDESDEKREIHDDTVIVEDVTLQSSESSITQDKSEEPVRPTSPPHSMKDDEKAVPSVAESTEKKDEDDEKHVDDDDQKHIVDEEEHIDDDVGKEEHIDDDVGKEEHIDGDENPINDGDEKTISITEDTPKSPSESTDAQPIESKVESDVIVDKDETPPIDESSSSPPSKDTKEDGPSVVDVNVMESTKQEPLSDPVPKGKKVRTSKKKTKKAKKGKKAKKKKKDSALSKSTGGMDHKKISQKGKGKTKRKSTKKGKKTSASPDEASESPKAQRRLSAPRRPKQKVEKKMTSKRKSKSPIKKLKNADKRHDERPTTPKMEKKTRDKPTSQKMDVDKNAAAIIPPKSTTADKEISDIVASVSSKSSANKPTVPTKTSTPMKGKRSVIVRRKKKSGARPANSGGQSPQSKMKRQASQNSQMVLVKKGVVELSAQERAAAIKMARAKNKVRQRVATELLSTEKSYVHSLDIVVRQLYIPVTSTSVEVLTSAEISNLFMNINDLLMHHMRFLSVLKDAVEKWTFQTTIGDVFLKNMNFLTMYRDYLTGYDTALITLRRVAKNEQWMTLQKAFERLQLKSSRLSLEAFLIMPVQRLPRYTLLLKELLKYTNEAHPDCKLLKQAIEKNRSALDDIHKDMDKDAAQHTLKLLSVTDSIANLPPDLQPLAKSKRQLLREGVVNVQIGQDSKPVPRYVFLMTDLVVVAEKKKKPEGPLQFSFVTTFDIYRVQSLLEIPLEHKKVNPKQSYGILVKQTGFDHSYVSFGFDSVQTRTDWLGEMRRLKSLKK